MRFDRTVFFCKRGAEHFNPKTGKVTEDPPEKVAVPCYISDDGGEAFALLYGKVEEGELLVITKGPKVPPFDFLEIEGKKYSATKTHSRHKTALRAKEIQG